MYDFFDLVMASAYGCLMLCFVFWLSGFRLVKKTHKFKKQKSYDEK